MIKPLDAFAVGLHEYMDSWLSISCNTCMNSAIEAIRRQKGLAPVSPISQALLLTLFVPSTSCQRSINHWDKQLGLPWGQHTALFRHVSLSGHQMESSISIQYFAVETPAYGRYVSHSYWGRHSREQMDLNLCTTSVTTLITKALTSGQLVYFISI